MGHTFATSPKQLELEPRRSMAQRRGRTPGDLPASPSSICVRAWVVSGPRIEAVVPSSAVPRHRLVGDGATLGPGSVERDGRLDDGALSGGRAHLEVAPEQTVIAYPRSSDAGQRASHKPNGLRIISGPPSAALDDHRKRIHYRAPDASLA